MREAQAERSQDGAQRPEDQPDQGGSQHCPQPELFSAEWFQPIFHIVIPSQPNFPFPALGWLFPESLGYYPVRRDYPTVSFGDFPLPSPFGTCARKGIWLG